MIKKLFSFFVVLTLTISNMPMNISKAAMSETYHYLYLRSGDSTYYFSQTYAGEHTLEKPEESTTILEEKQNNFIRKLKADHMTAMYWSAFYRKV